MVLRLFLNTSCTKVRIMSNYDNDEWVAGQEKAIQKCVVGAFQRQLDRLPSDDPNVAFLVSQGIYARTHQKTHQGLAGYNSTAAQVMDQAAEKSAAGGSIAEKMGMHHFNRAALGGPEGLFHMGHAPETLERLLAEHRKPDFVSQKAYDNSYRLGSMAKTVREAIDNHDLKGAMVSAFGARYAEFKRQHEANQKDRDDRDGQDLGGNDHS